MDTSRRGFLKGVGTTLAAVGITAAGGVAAATEPTTTRQHVTNSALASTAFIAGERMGRNMITQTELAMLVAEHLNGWIAQRQSFTAYEVTQALRQAHPSVNIMHTEVRTLVHRRMYSVVAAQFYRQTMLQFPGGSACHYLPAT